MAKPEVQKNYSLKDSIYLVELLKGLVLTWKHFIFNIGASFRKGPHTIPTTWQYPEDRRPISPIFRGEHMMMLDETGRELCVGCGMCAKVCPAKCITVDNSKVPEGQEDRYAGKTYSKNFNIDLLRCIFCGFCEEACPKGAIVLGQGYELAAYTHEGCQLGKDRLLENYKKAKASGTLKPALKPVPVAGAAQKAEATSAVPEGASKAKPEVTKKVLKKAEKKAGEGE